MPRSTPVQVRPPACPCAPPGQGRSDVGLSYGHWTHQTRVYVFGLLYTATVLNPDGPRARQKP